ncbi:hypothetical protein [Lentzea cavernae]|uniref:hypothetical protein n=1 Tax=Lentzea cavernae TaxID=2020703 RepID=UPI00174D75B8|nr:hypothetical protein [Lentzea cavernae]
MDSLQANSANQSKPDNGDQERFRSSITALDSMRLNSNLRSQRIWVENRFSPVICSWLTCIGARCGAESVQRRAGWFAGNKGGR